ncbi:MAG: hypothetical protein M1530_02600, partial [Candidatus Marsarchaeota archaeon]|nr:hypothetical protein [Candidatus Marsarchaeota archaeon]
MGRWERLAVLLLCVSLSSELAAESFTECFSTEKAERFWESSSYQAENPYIYNLGFARFYSFALDNSTQRIGVENLTLAQWDSLRQEVPLGEEKDFGAAATALSDAASTLQAAKDSQKEAHRLSLGAQGAASSYSFSPQNSASFTLDLLFSAYTPGFLMLKGAESLWRMRGIIEYVAGYQMFYNSALSNAASTYDSLNTAAAGIAQRVQDKYAWLAKAGAGSAIYSG